LRDTVGRRVERLIGHAPPLMPKSIDVNCGSIQPHHPRPVSKQINEQRKGSRRACGVGTDGRASASQSPREAGRATVGRERFLCRRRHHCRPRSNKFGRRSAGRIPHWRSSLRPLRARREIPSHSGTHYRWFRTGASEIAECWFL